MLSTTVYAKVRELNLAQGWNQKLTPLPNQTYVLNCMNISASLMVGDDILQQDCKFHNPCHACSRYPFILHRGCHLSQRHAAI